MTWILTFTRGAKMETIEKGKTYKVTVTLVSDKTVCGRVVDEAMENALCNVIGGDFDIGEYEEQLDT